MTPTTQNFEQIFHHEYSLLALFTSLAKGMNVSKCVYVHIRLQGRMGVCMCVSKQYADEVNLISSDISYTLTSKGTVSNKTV